MAVKPTATIKKPASARIMEDANPERSITDALGRVLVYRDLNVLDQYHLALAMGAAASDNGAAMRIATVACMVLSIDDVPYPRPTNPSMVEAAISRLGDEGLIALVVTANRQAEELKARTEANNEVPLVSPED